MRWAGHAVRLRTCSCRQVACGCGFRCLWLSRAGLVTPSQVALVGAPNVGKSSLVQLLSSGLPEVQNYPFTTRSIKMGHFYVDGRRHQVRVLRVLYEYFFPLSRSGLLGEWRSIPVLCCGAPTVQHSPAKLLTSLKGTRIGVKAACVQYGAVRQSASQALRRIVLPPCSCPFLLAPPLLSSCAVPHVQLLQVCFPRLMFR